MMAKEEKTVGVEPNHLIVGLDIGSSKIDVFIGEETDKGNIRVLGLGTPPLGRGAANELEATVAVLKKAVEDAEMTSGIDVKEVYVGIAGNNTRSYASRATIPLRDFGGVVTKMAMSRVVEQASELASCRYGHHPYFARRLHSGQQNRNQESAGNGRH